MHYSPLIFVGLLQVVPLPASVKEMQREVICVTNGITHPDSSWTINDQVVHGRVAINGWTFEPLTASSEVTISLFDTWQSAATGRLSLSESRNETVSLCCRHRLADGSYISSEPLMFLGKHNQTSR